VERWDSSRFSSPSPVLIVHSLRIQLIHMTHFFHIDDLKRQRLGKNKLYFEFLRVPPMSAGVYVLPKNGTDLQKPHREDEMYFVVRGRARMQVGSDHSEVRTGTIIFVEAEAEHRFYEIEEELQLLVFFAPAEQE
jgi:oxalate decarboxylase/phosphoglucose isomerase-like protein (cupin superfamily)